MGLDKNALTTLERVKSMLGLTDADGAVDDRLVFLINSASAWIARITGRTLGKNDYVEYVFASGQQELTLRQWPIIAVRSVADTTSAQIIDPLLYSVDMDGEIGVLFKDDGWPFAAYRGGLAYDPMMMSRRLAIDYTAGYVLPKDASEDDPRTLPYDLEQLVWEMVQQGYAALSSGGLSAFSISDVSWTFDTEPKQAWIHTAMRYARL